MSELNETTTEEAVATYLATNNIFRGLLKEVRELSKKKPDAIMSKGKVKIINRVLEDLKGILEVEPEGKFLDLLDDEELPQTSDGVLVMVQYETVLTAFKSRYFKKFRDADYNIVSAWVTPEFAEQQEIVEQTRYRGPG